MSNKTPKTGKNTGENLQQVAAVNNRFSGMSYDGSGNLLADATSTYTYDAENRIKTAAGVTYTYDGAGERVAKSTGTLYWGGSSKDALEESDASGASAWSLDPMGRALTEKRIIAGVTKSTNYTYNLDGSMATLQYPSGRTITYSYSPAGRALSAMDATNGINYATVATYAPAGALAGVKYGVTGTFTGITTSNSYNNRLQPTILSATAPSQTVINLSYDFHLGVNDNGNVYQITNNLDGLRPNRSNGSVQFTYDALSRVASVRTLGTACTVMQPSGLTLNWGDTFSYDPWGNLLTKSVSLCSAEGLSVSVTPTDGSPSKNQIVGYCYDAAGNLQGQTNCTTYAYDAENRLKTTAGLTYSYDGDGNRVAKSTSKLYWTGVGSDPLDESDAAGNINEEYVFFGGKRVARVDLPAGTVHYYFSDHLGSASVITSASGAIEQESDYYPFGGERVITSGPNTYKFTAKERDGESGLDDFGARYYSFAMGRFTSVDLIWVKGDRIADPQRLNLYAYARGNPLKFTDPTGMDVTMGRCAMGDVHKCFSLLQQGLRKDDRGHVHLVAGTGENGFKKGAYGVTVDKDYKSDSTNFQTLQHLANDHSATGTVDVLAQGDSLTVKGIVSWSAKTGPSLGNSSMTMDGKHDPFAGYTFFQFRGKIETGVIYTPGNYSEVVVNTSGLTGIEIVEAMHHELRHLFLGDFGRSAPNALHSDTFNFDQIPRNHADQETLDAEREAASNGKD